MLLLDEKHYLVKNINFEEIYWFPELYTFYWMPWISILKKYSDFQRYIPFYWMPWISILKKYSDFQRYIPFIGCHEYQYWRNTVIFRDIYLLLDAMNINIEEIQWFSEIYTFLLDAMNINIEEIQWFSEIYTFYWMPWISILKKYSDFQRYIPFYWMPWISILKKYSDFQRYIPFIGCHEYQYWRNTVIFRDIYLLLDAMNINIEEIQWFSEIYTFLLDAMNINTEEIQWFSEIYTFYWMPWISILKKYSDFQRYIPFIGCHEYQYWRNTVIFRDIYLLLDAMNINIEEIQWFSEIYTFYWMPWISILKKYSDFQRYIPFYWMPWISILKKYSDFQRYIPFIGCHEYQYWRNTVIFRDIYLLLDAMNINIEEIQWFSEIYTFYWMPWISILKKYSDFQRYIPFIGCHEYQYWRNTVIFRDIYLLLDAMNINIEEIQWFSDILVKGYIYIIVKLDI